MSTFPVVVPLVFGNRKHSTLIRKMVQDSVYLYREGLYDDYRLLKWRTNQGNWAVAVFDATPVGVVMLEHESSIPELSWLEVVPKYQSMGVGRALLAWCKLQTDVLVIPCDTVLIPFYEHVLGNVMPHSPRCLIWRMDNR